MAISSDAATKAGIDPAQHQVLLVVKGMKGEQGSVGDIANRLLIRHNSAVELIGRCERNGWVMRAKSHEDRRRVIVRLTESGEAILAELSEVHQRELQTAGPLLIKTLGDILKTPQES